MVPDRPPSQSPPDRLQGLQVDRWIVAQWMVVVVDDGRPRSIRGER
jgi:hypothetical protein